MTVPSTARRAGPFSGNGVTTTFSFSFKTFAAGDLQVTRMDALGLETTLVLNSDYSVSLNVDQDTSPGGTITYPISGSPLPAGQKLTIIGDLDYEQTTDLLGGGAFNARVIEDTFDRTVIQIQQLEERLDRALLVPVNSTANVQLPNPEANELIGWDSTGSNLANYSLSQLATGIAYGTMRFDTFTGDGTTTQFALTEDPAALANLDVSISGVTQVPGTDYTLTSATLVFTSAPANGVKILARYGRALPVSGPVDSSAVTHVAANTGAVATTVQAKLREMVSVLDFGADPTGVVDSTVAFENAHATGKLVYAPDGDYLVERIDVSGVVYVGLWGPGARLVLKADDSSGGLGYVYKVTDPGDFYLSVKEVVANTSTVKAGNSDNALVNVYTTGAARATNSVIIENTKFTGSAQRWGHIYVTNNEVYGNGARLIRVDATVHSEYGNYPAIRARGGHRAFYVSGCSFDNDNGPTINYGSPNSAITCSCEVSSVDQIGDIKVTGCNYQYGVGFFFGQKFRNCVIDAVNIFGEGKSSAGVSYGFNSTVIKIDDIGADATFAANNINIQSPSTQSAGYSFACEESTPNTTGTVTLSNWLTGGQVRCIALAKRYTLQSIRFVKRAGGSGNGYTGNMLFNLPSVPCFVSDCVFEELNPAFNDQNGYGVYTNNFFIDSSVVFFGTSDGSIYANNKFAGAGLSDAIVFDSLNSASPVRCTLINNQKVGTVTKNIRVAGTAASADNFRLTAINNTLDWSYSTLDSNSGNPNWYAVGNTSMTDKIRAAGLSAGATPSIQGLTTVITDGSGNSITNFADGRNWHRITVYLETGDTIVNGATIATKSGSNITGRAVRDFAYFGGVWHEC